MGRKILYAVIIIICLLIVRSSEIDRQETIKLEQQKPIKLAQNYNDGLWYIDNDNFVGAKNSLKDFYDGKYNNEEKYKDAQVIAIYANARYREYEPGVNYRLQYEFALDELNKIPKDYTGKYAADIVSFRGKVQDRLDTYARVDKEREEERKRKIYIGDSEYKVLNLLGEPIRKNKTVIGNTVREQWVYNNKYIYIENGSVVAWQD